MTIQHWGDSAITVELGNRIDVSINEQVVALADALQAAGLGGVRDIVPTFRSVTIYFDPLRTDQVALGEQLLQLTAGNAPVAVAAPRELRIPVCYGEAFGPDLADVARFAGIDEPAAVALHTGVCYRVFMLGFSPGFAYMGSVPQRIAMPRRETPRLRVPAGAVGIAGVQTGVYPLATPGGWRLVGRSPVLPFDLHRPEPFLFRPGDSVRFFSIKAEDFEKPWRVEIKASHS